MIISKKFINDVFEETKRDFSSKIIPLDNNIEIEYMDSQEFLDDARTNTFIAFQIQKGVYKNFDKEYPNFMCVYFRNKNEMQKLLGLPYKISIAFDIAKDRLKPFSKKDVKAYLKHGFAHELAHVYEDMFISSAPDSWDSALMDCNGDEGLAKELLADSMALKIENSNSYESITKELWSTVYRRMEKLK